MTTLLLAGIILFVFAMSTADYKTIKSNYNDCYLRFSEASGAKFLRYRDDYGKFYFFDEGDSLSIKTVQRIWNGEYQEIWFNNLATGEIYPSTEQKKHWNVSFYGLDAYNNYLYEIYSTNPNLVDIKYNYLTVIPSEELYLTERLESGDPYKNTQLWVIENHID